jgi:hypothetical protein
MDASIDDLVAEIRHTATALAAAHGRLLGLIAQANRDKRWAKDGAASPAGWLVAQLGISQQSAASWSQVADRLEDLPAISSALERGEVSFDQAQALSRFATSEDDTDLAASTPEMSVAQLRRQGRRTETIDIADVRHAHDQRRLKWWWNEPERMFHFSGRVPDHEGVVVAKALHRIALYTPPDPETGCFEDYEARCAEALVQMASQSLGEDADPDRSCVVVHVDASRLGTDDAVGQVVDGPAVSIATVKRWACDGRVEIVAENGAGLATGVGRATRRIPAWLGRQLQERDGGCRFPGCERTRWVHGHHLVHWSQGGPTDLENLAMLCGYHHRLVHEHGWHIAGDPNKVLTWVRPDGQPLQPRPDSVPPDTRRRQIEHRIEHESIAPWDRDEPP